MGGQKMECCSPCMGGVCSSLGGLMVVVAGAAFLLFAFGSIDVMVAHVVAGAMLVLYGLGAPVHAAGMCPMCKK